MTIDDDSLDEILARVLAGKDYANINPLIIRRLAGDEIKKNRNQKETIKAIRSKLHQVAGAYITKKTDYQVLADELKNLPHDPESEELQSFCQHIMQNHASTRERLLILEDFFQETLASLAPVRSILDIGCGLNPLALPWMPLAQNASYTGLDIYHDSAPFLNLFIKHIGCRGSVMVGDMLQPPDMAPAEVAFLLKIFPCLEQQARQSSSTLLEIIPAEKLLVSFPVYSLGGRAKGMRQFYEEQFLQTLQSSSKDWQVQRFEFSSELVFLIWV